MGSSRVSLPRVLGRYAIYDKIAEGGMASVHVGRLVGAVGFSRTVAIKMMQPQLCEDREFVSMFLDEARVAARINHPNVVTTLDVVADAGELLLVMDYVHGEALARLVRLAVQRQERLPPAMVTTVMASVLHGLHAAHEAKSDLGAPLDLVHRDVSPQNVLVGADGVARVLDFGVAKAVGRLQNTRTGQLKGKLAYMSPEQARGVVTRRTDVYAAAVVLWEALTGRRLFAGANEVEVLGAVLRGGAAAPSQLAPGIPAALDAIVLRGLDGNPDNRFATAREMARALEDALPPMSASRVGDLVMDLARESLEARAARIAEIERDSPGQREAGAPQSVRDRLPSNAGPRPATGRGVAIPATAAAAAPPPAPPSPPRAPAPTPEPTPAYVDDGATIVTDPAAYTQMTAGSHSASLEVPVPPKAPSQGRRVVGAVVAGVLIAAAAAAVWKLGGPLRGGAQGTAAAAGPVVDAPAVAHAAPAMEGVVAFPEPPAAASGAPAVPSAGAARKR